MGTRCGDADRERGVKRLNAVPWHEFFASAESERLRVLREGKWGRWTLDRDELVLRFEGCSWYFPLVSCDTSAKLLDYVCQASGKAWTTSEDIGDLVAAVVAIIGPQRHLCSHGEPLAISDMRTFLRAQLSG